MPIYTKEEQFILIEKDYTSLRRIDNQYEDVCIEAVKQNVNALQFVKEQTEDICLEAVKQDGYALEYVKDQTEEICLAALNKDVGAFKYIKEPTYQMCIDTIKSDNSQIQYLNNLSSDWYGDILKYSILHLDVNEEIDFSKYGFFISNYWTEEFEFKNIKNKNIGNLKIIPLSFFGISKNNFLNYIIDLNGGFSFILDDSLDKKIWNKLIFSNNYVIGLYNSDKTKHYSKLLDYTMEKEEFEIHEVVPF